MTNSVPAIGLRLSSTSQHFTPVSCAFLADEFERRHLELAFGAFGLRGRGAHLGRPVGPDGELVFLLRRLRADVELGDADRALAEGGADAVGSGVATADHDDMLAAGHDRLRRPGDRLDVLAADALVLLHEIRHRVMHAVEVVARNAGVARRFRAAAIEHGIMFGEQLGNRLVDADIDAAMEGDALALHLLDAAVDVVLLHLEVRDAVAHQPAGLALALIDMDIVAGAAKLLRGGHAGRAGADDCDALAGLRLRRMGPDIARLIGLVGDRLLDRLDRDGNVLEVQGAGFLAGRGADAAGEFRELLVEWRLRIALSQSPL